MPSLRSPILVLSLLALLLWCAPAHAERRTALVIGNGAYKAAPLKNPTNDAQDIADALREMGFDVTLKLNATNREMEEAVRTFGAKLKLGGLGLFYYAGHGVQVAGENYLIPVDTKIDAEADVKFGALNAGMALARMEDAGNDLNIVILDACRTNPFARSFRTAEQGLARMDAPKGSLIAYATAPGRVAADSGSTGRNGVYTSFLLRHMRAPGLKIEEILKRVRADVVRATKDKQVPWESSSLIGDFYFVMPQVQAPQAASILQATVLPPAQALEHQQAKSSTNSELLTLQGRRPEENTYDDQKPQADYSDDMLYNMSVVAFMKKDYVISVNLARKAAEHGHAKSQLGLALTYYDGRGVPQNYAEALKWIRKAVEQGLPEAQYYLGVIYRDGKAVPKDYVESSRWYLKSSENGYDEAQFKLGLAYSLGQGVPRNEIEAVKWFRLAADQGHAGAQFNLGVMYSKGNGVSQNYSEAVSWYRKSAEQGLAQAQHGLGIMYAQGLGVPQSYREAVKWSIKAAEQGFATAQYSLGIMYDKGNGVPQDYSEAVKWYRKAAEQGHAAGQALLASMYALGHGVQKNFERAFKWTKISSEQGYVLSQTMLGKMYINGEGAPKNLIQALMWFSIAATFGDAEALEARDVIATKMTPAQVAEAQKLASQWRPKTPLELGLKPALASGADEALTVRGDGKVAARKNNKAQK